VADALIETNLAGFSVRRGKVRDVYDLGGDRLLIVATDRISAFDWVLPGGIPDKGRILTGISAFWFEELGGDGAGVRDAHHLISTDIDAAALDLEPAVRESLHGRSMVVRKAEVVPFECVVRGYLSGSAWREYRASGTVCGETLPPGLVESEQIEPIFTPATKAESGHDENVPLARMAETIGADLAEFLRGWSIHNYLNAWSYALTRGLILADTKFEFGVDLRTGEVLLVDEVLTPDSSRYWPADRYKPGGPQPSFDKQYVRDWLETTGWDKASPPPPLPEDVVLRTRDKYVDAFEILTGRPFPWK
jgi:phosphoribosylaminoimidazole-succinocarboxamide synthase